MFRSLVVVVPLLICVVALTVAAGIGINWKKSEVVPVILVKPGIGGFIPVEGSSIGNTWSKSDVKPVLLVKPGISDFGPREGLSIGNTWKRGEIVPVLLLKPSSGGFAPLELFSDSGKNTNAPSPPKHAPTGTSPSIIESQIDGDFNGWDGDTIVKLVNGQIWQQTEFHYHYHYAFMPNVLVHKSSGGYKMKVDGVDKAVGVKRLK